MGAYTCQYGVVHKVCRCPKPHTIRCDVPEQHSNEYKPKHRGEPRTVWRVTFIESERGWGQTEWKTDYPTKEEAWQAYRNVNSQNTSPVVPDVYVKAISVEEITL